MLPFGFVAMGLGALLMAFGLFGDTTVTGSGGTFGMDRVHNLGLLGRQAALVTSGIGLLIAGSVFAVGGMILAQLATLSAARSQPALMPAWAPPSPPPRHGPTPELRGEQPMASSVQMGPVVPNNEAGWRHVTAMAEQQGWRVTSGLTGVSFRRPDGHTFKPATPQEAANALTRAAQSS